MVQVKVLRGGTHWVFQGVLLCLPLLTCVLCVFSLFQSCISIKLWKHGFIFLGLVSINSIFLIETLRIIFYKIII